MRDYKKIIAWQRSHDLTLQVYQHTKYFPDDERFGLTSQLRRAAYSVPANIAEGSGRNTQKDYLRFLPMAFGSLRETKYFFLLARELGYLEPNVHEKLTEDINSTFAALHGLIKAVERDRS